MRVREHEPRFPRPPDPPAMRPAVRFIPPTTPVRALHTHVCCTCAREWTTYEGESPRGWREAPTIFADGPRLECPRCQRARRAR